MKIENFEIRKKSKIEFDDSLLQDPFAKRVFEFDYRVIDFFVREMKRFHQDAVSDGEFETLSLMKVMILKKLKSISKIETEFGQHNHSDRCWCEEIIKLNKKTRIDLARLFENVSKDYELHEMSKKQVPKQKTVLQNFVMRIRRK